MTQIRNSNETIVDRVVQRLKTQPLGDLITEEDLHDVVKQAIPKTFFENRTINDGSYHTKTLPPMIIEIMGQVLREHVKNGVDQWMADNAHTVAECWKKVFDVGIETYVQQMQDARATASVRLALQPWANAENQRRAAAGLPPIYI